MGGIETLWRGDLQASLVAALAADDITDQRATLGATRGGRKLSAEVTQRVLAA
jgi:malonate decarboxylase gamma subunit